MKKALVIFFALTLAFFGIAPAQSADSTFKTSTRTLTAFKSGSKLSAAQMSQVRQLVETNPGAESLTCTGLRLKSASKAQVSLAKARAKSACDYAKTLNPSLAISSSDKATSSRSVAGKVMLTIKSPAGESAYYATFKNYCDRDPNPGEGFAELEAKSQSLMFCGVATRLVEVPMPSATPKTPITDISELLPAVQCRLQNGPSARAALGFPRADQRHFSMNPGPDTTYQVLPIYTNDAPHLGKTPSADYGHYFRLIEQWSRFNSDWSPTAEVRVPSVYKLLPKTLAEFKIRHGSIDEPEKMDFLRQVIALFDAEINFSDVDYILIVVPPATPRSIIEQSQLLNATTAERSGIDAVVLPGIPMVRDSINSDSPMSWMHGFVHAAVDFDDHYGDQQTKLGMGHWGIMTRVKTDFLALEKWQLGAIRDSQVRCADGKKATTHWLAPSQIRTTLPKTLIVPTGQYTAVVVESVRALGINYRLPERSEGVLVYTINTNSDKHGFGFDVVTDEIPNVRTNFIFEEAPLKVGESVKVSGIRITVKEAGKWGDVIEVAPAN